MALTAPIAAAGWMETLPLLLLESAVKATLILAVVLTILALARSSSSLRHALWTTALLATLPLPMLALGLPELRWLPSWLDFSAAEVWAVDIDREMDIVIVEALLSARDNGTL